ncbi:LysR family transcriptional regulator [Actinoplanes sp. NPDC051633]|uniref:LysR family transcriptional regulator n=1 Tax=Actinoplanes sp. NPDC051633 TaxID=3155670 RepID=UPI00342EEE0B
MEIGQLRCFAAVVDTGTFTAAARQVRLGQSAVSASIAQLERQLGSRLFERTRTSAVLTAAGKALLPHARALLAEEQRAREAVDAVEGRVAGTVSIGLTLVTGRVDVTAMLIELRDRHPDVQVQLVQSLTGPAAHITAVREGRLDMALVTPVGAPPRDITLHTLLTEPMVVLCRGDDPLARRRKVDVEDLTNRPYLALPAGWGVRAMVDAARGPDAPPPVVEVAEYTLLGELVAAGVGVAVVPRPSFAGFGHLSVVPTDLTWRLCLAEHAARPPTAARAVVADAVRRHAHSVP